MEIIGHAKTVDVVIYIHRNALVRELTMRLYMDPSLRQSLVSVDGDAVIVRQRDFRTSRYEVVALARCIHSVVSGESLLHHSLSKMPRIWSHHDGVSIRVSVPRQIIPNLSTYYIKRERTRVSKMKKGKRHRE